MRVCKKIQKEKNYGIKRRLLYPGVYVRGKQKTGHRFLRGRKAVYQEALEIELKKAEIPYGRENNQSYSLIHPCLSVSVRGYFEIGIPEGNSTYSSGLKKTTKY
jgi:hypothetical protein